MPGGIANAFWLPVSSTSMPSASKFIGTVVKLRDGVDDEHHVRKLLLQRGDLLERAQHAGGGFVVHEREGVELAGRELFARPAPR